MDSKLLVKFCSLLKVQPQPAFLTHFELVAIVFGNFVTYPSYHILTFQRVVHYYAQHDNRGDYDVDAPIQDSMKAPAPKAEMVVDENT